MHAGTPHHQGSWAPLGGTPLVVQGPPGTGESRPFANLVAALAADGKLGLFVAEKRAAIDAVVGRLTRVGLGDLVMDLHDGARAKRRIAVDLSDALEAAAEPAGKGPPGPPPRGHDDPAVAPAAHIPAMHDQRAPRGGRPTRAK